MTVNSTLGRRAKGLLNLLTNLNANIPAKFILRRTVKAMWWRAKPCGWHAAGLGQVVNTYMAMQGAVAAHSYDPTAPTLSTLRHLSRSGTPNCYAQYCTTGAPCYFNGSAGAGTYVNFFNTNDWALSADIWQYDQDRKPDAIYGYSFTSPDIYDSSSRQLFFPGDTYALFAYVIQARSYALGAQPNMGGAFLTGTNFNQIELDAIPYKFGPQHIYHSGEFRSDYAQRWQFWDEVLFQMGLKRNL